MRESHRTHPTERQGHSFKRRCEDLTPEAAAYIASYRKSLTRPLSLITRHGIEQAFTFPSDIDGREKVLEHYLSVRAGIPFDGHGRAYVAEITAGEMIAAYLEEAGFGHLRVIYAPAGMEGSVRNICEYHKGADLVIVNAANRNKLEPLMGVDVSLGNAAILKDKRRKPGIQTTSGIPVAVLGFTELEGPEVPYFEGYFDASMRPAIQTGTNTRLVGLSAQATASVMQRMRACLGSGLVHCGEQLLEARDPFIAEHPARPLIERKIGEMQTVFAG